MFSIGSFFLGLLSGILATLIAGNPHVRFHFEKAFRKLLRKSIISISLTSFTNFCNGGIFLIHCIEIKNNMWLTPKIPRVYFLSRGTFAYDAHAYKPFIYFRSHGLSEDRLSFTPVQLLEEYNNQIVPYAPDNPTLSMDISRTVSKRVAVICELIDLDKRKEQKPMNHLKIIGKLHAAVANPMPTVTPSAWWRMSIISEDFGFIDSLLITIPEDLEKREPLGDTVDVMNMTERPACLMDIDYCGFTWPLRFKVNNRELKIRKKDYSNKAKARERKMKVQ